MKDCRGKQKAMRKQKQLEMQTNTRSTITSMYQAGLCRRQFECIKKAYWDKWEHSIGELNSY